MGGRRRHFAILPCTGTARTRRVASSAGAGAKPRDDRSEAMQPNMRMLQQMQNRMAKIQEELGQTLVTGSAGGGAVTVEVTGLQELKGIKLSAEVVDPEDVETLEDLLVVAVNDAMEKAKELSSQKFGALTGGMKIPGLF